MYNCLVEVNSCVKEVVLINNFVKKDDVFVLIVFMLDGKGEFFIIFGFEVVGGIL